MNILCKTCKVSLPSDNFWKAKNKLGFESRCKQCRQSAGYEKRRERRIKAGLVVKFPTLAARQLMTEGKKYCPGCKEIYDHSAFSTMNVGCGLSSHCLSCMRELGRRRRDRPDGKSKQIQIYKQQRPNYIRRRLMKDYGMTPEDYYSKIEQQGGGCAICGRTAEVNKKMLAVDHNHTTGKNRGILCQSCNICIGFIEKNNMNLNKISDYLTKHSSLTVDKNVVSFSQLNNN